MAFTAEFKDISLINDQFVVRVTYLDSATGFTCDRTFHFPDTHTQAEALAEITATGQALKANLVKSNNLRSKIGTVITIN